MQYESILLELMSRIKTLEKEQIVLQEKVDALMNPSCKDFSFQESEVSENVHPGPKSYLKMTEEMMEMCYMAGKKLYSDEKLNIGILADEISTKTGMNRSSAVMYIYVVDCMLKGNVYKRAISTKATEKYFKEIYGLSIYAYLKEKRIQKAAELLRETNHEIGKIAGMVGYDNASKFSNSFKSIMGINPSEYKKSV